MENSKEKLPEFIRPSLKLYLLKNVTSKTPNHRTILRKKLLETLTDLSVSTEDPASLLNLDKIPSHPKVGLSLSHCTTGSALLIDLDNKPIGVDLEEAARISDKLIHRVSLGDEESLAPNPHWLFTSKEAAWKALNTQVNVPTISHLKTRDWHKNDSNWYTYKVEVNDFGVDGTGYFTQFSDTYLSFYIGHSTFGEKHRQR